MRGLLLGNHVADHNSAARRGAMYVCICLAVTTSEIESVIDSGAASTKRVGQRCGAGTSCGKCKNTIRRIIEAKQAAKGAK